ncbi:MAG: triose-phosphate isomerase, partial [Bacteroidales bacterium]|nr:triose-phosphate isomerase [Bacteroidales bacterium]
MRRKMVAGNWKMNMNFQEPEELLDELVDRLDKELEGHDVDVVVCPPAPYLEMAYDLGTSEEDENQVYFSVGAQNVNEHDKGA